MGYFFVATEWCVFAFILFNIVWALIFENVRKFFLCSFAFNFVNSLLLILVSYKDFYFTAYESFNFFSYLTFLKKTVNFLDFIAVLVFSGIFTLFSFLLFRYKFLRRQAIFKENYFAKKTYNLKRVLNLIFKCISGKSVNVEIGTGKGHFLEKIASNTDNVFLGVEIREKYLKKAYKKLKHYKNVFLFECDAKEFIGYLKDESILNFYILHPDPWPKKRHRKRRLLNCEFIKKVYSKLKKGGKIFIVSDVLEYIESVLKEVNLLGLKSSGVSEDLKIPESLYMQKKKKDGKIYYVVIKKI